jgi:heme a synthase
MLDPSSRKIVIWLLIGCLLTASMVVIGGITRLTGSGLSITEWNLIMGTFPPINQQDWETAFNKYKASPQFQKINYDFTLSDFKTIFFWEYLHRLLGRMIGMVFLIPFLYFLFTRKLKKTLIKNLLLIFALGGLQGFLGWFMVKSGLVDNPHVSHYRLAAHLITAFITYGFTLWVALDLIYERSDNNRVSDGLKPLSRILLIVVVLQIIYGAFVAGLKAGRVYNTFPKMAGQWIPDAINAMQPSWINIFENLTTVQFIHRCIGWLMVLLVVVLWLYSRKKDIQTGLRNSIRILMVMVVMQFTLGVLTLLYAVPVTLGVLHQLGALVVFTSAIFLNHQMGSKMERL